MEKVHGARLRGSIYVNFHLGPVLPLERQPRRAPGPHNCPESRALSLFQDRIKCYNYPLIVSGHMTDKVAPHVMTKRAWSYIGSRIPPISEVIPRVGIGRT